MQDEHDMGPSLTSRGLPRDPQPDAFDDDRVGGGAETEDDDGAIARRVEAMLPSTAEEPDARPPLVLDLNMNKVKLRELRACERILAVVFGRVVPVLPMLEEMPADLAIALLAHKKLVSEDVDCSRLSDSGVLEHANDVREAFAWAEEIDFADLGAPAQAEGEGSAPLDPPNGSSGNGQQPSANTPLTSGQPS